MAPRNGGSHRLARLRGRSLDEWRVRGGQRLSILLERMGMGGSTALPLSGEEWLRHFRERATPRFFASFDDRAATVAALRAYAPANESVTIARADTVIAGRFQLLGHEPLSFGDPIDWQLDPVRGARAPRHHWSRIRYLDPRVVGDHKLVWELNRHQFLVTLGQAYWYTNDERYTDAFVRLVNHWIDENPAPRGINWASSLEVGFRAIAWVWALYFFRESDRLTPAFFTRITSMLARHARHLQRYLSTYFSPNTHLTGEAMALLYVGGLLPEVERSAMWREMGRTILLERLPQHVLDDGVYFERATWYHLYTVDFYLHALILGARNGWSTEAIAPPLERATEALMHMTRPGGRIPRIGDDDGGRLLFLDQRAPDDVRGALGTAAVLFRRSDLRFGAGEATAELIWLLGPEGARSFAQLPAVPPRSTSRAFPEGGVYVLRDGWSEAAAVMTVDCGAHGALSCGHAHADALSFELSLGTQPILVDPGTYTYTLSAKERDWFRGTRAHNTATVDGKDSSATAGPFSWTHVASCRAVSWQPGDAVDYLSAEHDGFARLADPTIHRREILFVKGEYWIIRDTFSCRGEHAIELGFQCVPGLSIERSSDDSVVFRADSRPLLRVQWWPERSEPRIEDGWVSKRYGARERAPRLSLQTRISGLTSLLTALAPARSDVNFRLVDTVQGQALRVDGPRTIDTVLFDTGTTQPIDGIATSAPMAWVRREDGAVTHHVVAGDTSLTVDGVVPRRGSVSQGAAAMPAGGR